MYEDIEKVNELKKFMEEKLEDYNMEPGIIGMDLVLFKDAIEHGGCNKYTCILFNGLECNMARYCTGGCVIFSCAKDE